MRKMSVAEREAFLAQPRVGILSVAAEPDRAPLSTPIWYHYRPGGDLWVLTDPNSRKARLISAAGRFNLAVQDESLPYPYVVVEGPVVESRPSTGAELREITARYFAPDSVETYAVAAEAANDPAILIRIAPERWNAVIADEDVAELGLEPAAR